MTLPKRNRTLSIPVSQYDPPQVTSNDRFFAPKNAIKIILSFILILSFIPIRAGYQIEEIKEIEKIEQMTHRQEVWIHALEYCESSGRENIKVMDSNNRYSYGVLQFQMETFLREGKKYDIIDQNLTAEEAEEIIYGTELQEKIAHQMLLAGGEGNWYNCWKRIGERYPKVE